MNLQSKTVCFTFDDGPSKVTGDLLDILDKNNVKSTFFVCKNGECSNMYNEILTRGHDIGIHSTTHEYKKIYANLQSWKEDFNEIYDYVTDNTGFVPKFYRFPGGSYGTSSKFLRGNREQFYQAVDYIHSINMEYIDWNVCIDDGDSRMSTEDVVFRCLNSDESIYRVKSDYIIILAHDHAGMKQSVSAIPEIIQRVRDEGATIKKLDDSFPKCQSSKHIWLDI